MLLDYDMRDESWEYSADDTATAAVGNNVTWAKVKIKNTIRYAGIAVVLVAFYHLFAPFLGSPSWPLYVDVARELWALLPMAGYNYAANVFIGAAAAAVVWFMP